MNTANSQRLHALDTVRGGALLLGVFFHAAIAYMPSSEMVWMIEDSSKSPVMSVLYYVSHSFRLITFFLIAGSFARMSFHKNGAGAFLKDRFKRLGIPFVVGWIVMMPVLLAVIIWGFAVSNGGEIPDDLPQPPPPSLLTIDLTHLWFLYVLLLFILVTVIFRAPVVLLDRGGVLRNGVDRLISELFRTPLVVVALAIPAAAALSFHDEMWVWFGMPTPNFGLIPLLPPVAGYGTPFLVGWLLHRQPDVLFAMKRTWLLYAIMAIALTTWCLSQVSLVASHETMDFGLEKTLYVFAYSIAGWCWTMAFIGGAFVFFSGASRVRRYIADSSYWLYIIHMPIVIALQILFLPYEWSWAVKYSLVMGISLSVMLVSYHYLVRYSFIGAILNGRRRRREEIDAPQGSEA